MNWHLERTYTWVIRKKWYLKIVNLICVKGELIDIAKPQNEVLQKRNFYRLFNKFNIWGFKECYKAWVKKSG